ncbi:hypothetical protein D3C71_1711370 [compost metagenome]
MSPLGDITGITPPRLHDLEKEFGLRPRLEAKPDEASHHLHAQCKLGAVEHQEIEIAEFAGRRENDERPNQLIVDHQRFDAGRYFETLRAVVEVEAHGVGRPALDGITGRLHQRPAKNGSGRLLPTSLVVKRVRRPASNDLIGREINDDGRVRQHLPNHAGK